MRLRRATPMVCLERCLFEALSLCLSDLQGLRFEGFVRRGGKRD
jgi:hypothetical protein